MVLQMRDTWSAAYVNDLPDSAFLLITPGGTKDSTGRTMPRTNRYFPVYDANGKVDEPHLANALARIPQASSLTADQRAQAMTKAKALAKKTGVSGDVGEYTGSAGSGRSKERMPAEAMGLQTRTFDLVLEVRADGDGRTLVGRAVPYGETAAIAGGTERFVMGAFARQIAGKQLGAVKLFDSHYDRENGRRAVGKTVSLTERTDGLHGAWSLYDTAAGEDALKLVKAGEVTGLSVGFKAVDGGTSRDADGAYVRHAVHLDHVALTDSPAYVGAQVLTVRSRMNAAGYRTELLRARHILDGVLAAR